MTKVLLALLILWAGTPSPAADLSARPKILGIAAVRILASDDSVSPDFYAKLFPLDHPCIWCGQPRRTTFSVNESQFIEIVKSPWPLPLSLIDEIIFSTSDLLALKLYLKAHNIPYTSPVIGLDDNPVLREMAKNHPPSGQPRASNPPESDVYIAVSDPEGNRIGFVQSFSEPLTKPADDVSRKLVHAGFVVKNRAAEDHFYRDILGFHLYWQGGMKDSEIDWVCLQVPDGTDWIEYMLNVPDDASQHFRGVMNHIAIGVFDIEDAGFAARKNGVSVKESPKLGRDGKWQLNLYDPDGTRIEFMEFTPVEKPCCSDYTGPHPQP